MMAAPGPIGEIYEARRYAAPFRPVHRWATLADFAPLGLLTHSGVCAKRRSFKLPGPAAASQRPREIAVLRQGSFN
jgi:hypothetical protein